MDYLVTGGAGFIGSHLARRLLEQGHRVTVADNLFTGFACKVPSGAGFIEVDIGAEDATRRLPQKRFDAVLHLAAQSSGEISFERPEYDVMTNVMGTLNMLRWCEATGTRRFLLASSMSVYGDVEDTPIVENHPRRPNTPYGAGKLAGEGYLNVFSRRGLKTTCLRLFNVYGPGQNLDNMKQGMVSIYLRYVLDGKPVLVKGPGERFRDVIYIADVVDAWLTVLNNPASFGQTYNVGTGRKTRVSDLVRKVIAAFGHSPDAYPVVYADGTPGDQFGIVADSSKIRQELGWFAKTSLDEGLSRMANWALECRRNSDMGRPEAD